MVSKKLVQNAMDYQLADLQALCEICIMENKGFGAMSRDVRQEFDLSVCDAIDWTLEGLELVYVHGKDPRAYGVAMEFYRNTRRELPVWMIIAV